MPRGKAISFDASRKSLFDPGSADDIFALGPYSSEAGLCAEMARAAYVRSKQGAKRCLQRVGFELLAFADNASDQGFTAADDSTVVMAFRGTEGDDPHDIGTDINFLPRRWERGGRVHRGFADALNDVWTELAASLPGDGRRVLYTGHSLGAAMATLAASRRPPDMLYSFGSPMVGNGAFGATLKGVAHARFQNCTDIVARIPAGLPGFEHTGTLHYLDRHGKLQLRAGARVVRPDQRIAAFEYFAQWAWRSGSAPLRELADHAPINYVSGALGRRGARTAV